MSAFIIADIKITDPEGYQEYIKLAPPTIAAHGGKYIARGGEVEVAEGDYEPNRIVIVEFPDMETLKTWYYSEEYSHARAIRQKHSEGSITMVDQGTVPS